MPDLAGLFTRIVRIEEPEPVMVDGFQEADMRVGSPFRLRLTVPVKPPAAATLIVSEPVLPRATVSVEDEADREKSPVEVTTNVTLTEWLSVEVAPVMVSV